MPVQVTAKAAAQQFLRGLCKLACGRVRKGLQREYGDDITAETVHEAATCVEVGNVLCGQKGTDPAVIDFVICALKGFGSLNTARPGVGNLYARCLALQADQVFGKAATSVLAAIDAILDPSNTASEEQQVSGDYENDADDTRLNDTHEDENSQVISVEEAERTMAELAKEVTADGEAADAETSTGGANAADEEAVDQARLAEAIP